MLTKIQMEQLRNLSTIGRDISERKHSEEQMMSMANRDPLTNLLNCRRFHEELKGWLAQTQRFGIKGALLFLDIDNFKYINDSLGHQAGDKFLITIADLLRARLRETDILARMGGDEFAIILPHADVSLAESVANQIRELVLYHTSLREIIPLALLLVLVLPCFPAKVILWKHSLPVPILQCTGRREKGATVFASTRLNKRHRLNRG